MVKKRKNTKNKITKRKTKKISTAPKTEQITGPLMQDPLVRLAIWASFAIVFIAAIVLLV